MPRAENTEADILSKIALGGIPDHLLRICQTERVLLPSVEPKPVQEIICVTEEISPEEHPEIFWMEEIRRYKKKGDPVEAAKIQRRSPAYVLMDGHMYKKSFGGPLLRCLFPADANQVMEEAHRGICAAHQGAHTLARKLVL